MNLREQEIWKRCYTGTKNTSSINSKYGARYPLTVEFSGNFVCDSPVYHYRYDSVIYVHIRDIDGWEDPVNHTPGRDGDNDPRFPKPPETLGMYWKNIIVELFTHLLKGLDSLKPFEPPPPKTLDLLRKCLPIHEELIWLICTNLLIVELDWLEKQIN